MDQIHVNIHLMLEWFILHDGGRGRGEGVSQFKWGSAPKRTQPGKESKEKRPKRDNKRVNEYKK